MIFGLSINLQLVHLHQISEQQKQAIENDKNKRY